ncbi:hypothetical protein AVEN_249703-1 [Araneus ventricosus]|uniref:RNase H type-1 domain-containing protein n=1 Tax=Araneus ventricosus TaxID=182803 RepID=A0A4Y2UBV0_ARAVE|nr:hypothetical protein AVEN_238902-1 [Araneus ventricosus]GBO09478.1 hypothetical protein AVEN_249703-1 [Araneus ventricosus]
MLLKARRVNRGNEEADTLAKKAITEGVVMKVLNPRCELKQHLQELFLKKWQNLWDNGNTGRSVHKVLKTVNLKPVFWTREEIMFVTGHGPFPSFLNRFHLSDSDSCACGEVGEPIHYATSCPLTLSWHIRTPSTSLESLWYQRVLENPNSRKRIINMIKFIIDNENIMRLSTHLPLYNKSSLSCIQYTEYTKSFRSQKSLIVIFLFLVFHN